MVVKLKLNPGAGEGILDSASLDASPGVRIETAPVKIPALGEADWRVAADTPGEHILKFKIGDKVIEKTFSSGKAVHPVSLARVAHGFFNTAANPDEKPIASGLSVDEIRIDYPDRALMLAGRNVNWLVFFFVVSILFGFAFKPIFKVEM